MHSFILKQRPNSYNSNIKAKKTNYTLAIQNAFRKFYPIPSINSEEELYGTIYYFYKKDLGLDADNISKPVWDGLTGFLYTDDKQIRLRIAGCFDLSKNDLTALNVSGLAGNILIELLDALEKEEHVVYIECGVFHNSLFKFNLVTNGN